MSVFDRLKPYFKSRPPGAAPPAPAAAPTQVQQAAPPPAPAAAPAPPAAPSDGLAARRDELARRYQELQSDLGGLVYEMAIRDAFRLDVVVRRAAELQAVDAELTGVEQSMGISAGQAPAAAGCPSCGAPAPAGSTFCGRCGAALGAPPPQVPGVPR